MAEGGSVSIKVLLDTAEFKSGINQVKQDLNNLKTGNVDKIDTSLDKASKSADELAKSTEKASEGIEKAGEEAEKASEEFEKLGEEAEKAGEGIDKAGKKGSNQKEPLSEAPKQGSEKWKMFGNDVQNVGRTLESVGSFATKAITVPMLAAAAASVAAAVDIDTSLTNVRKTVDGTEQQYQQLKQAAIEFSKTNAVSASQMLDIQALGAQLGFSLSELQEFGEVVSSLEISTNMSADQAAEELAHFANITGLAHDEIRNYGSAIVDLGNHFATTESDISAMALRIASAGSQAGMSQADILGLATALSSVGIEAEAGGTAISQIMIKISNDVAKNTENLQTWAETAGMSAEQFAEKWKSSPVEALSAVLAGMNDATQESGKLNLILDELGITGIRQGDTLRRLAGAYEMTTDAVRTANEAWVDGTALQAEVDNRNNSLAAKFEMLRNRVIAVADAIGGSLAEALLNILNAAEPLFQAIEQGAQAFNNMSKEQQGVVLAAAGIAAAFGPVISVVGKVVGSFGRMGKEGAVVQSGLDLITAGVQRASGALGALKFTGILAGISAVLALIPAFITKFSEMQKSAENFEKATSGASGIMESFQSAASSAASGAKEYSKSLNDVWENIGDVIKRNAELSDSIKESFADAGKDSGLIDYYTSVIDELANQGKNLTDLEQGQLANAVAGLNDILGTNISILDSQTGQLDTTSAALHRYADAAKAAALEAAAQSAYQEIASERIQLTMDLAGAQQALTNRQNEYNEALNRGEIATDEQKMIWGEYVGEAQRWVDNYGQMIDSLDEKEKLVSQTTAELAGKLAATSEQMKQSAQGSESWQSALDTLGEKTGQFFDDLSSTKINMEDFLGLTPEQIDTIVSSYDGTVESITNALDGMAINAAESGAAAAEAWYSNFSEGTQQSAQAAADAAQMTLDEFYDSVPEYARASEDALMEYINGLKSGTGEGGEQAAETEAQGLEGAEGDFQSAGESHGQAYDEGIPQGADGSGGNQAVQNEINAMQGREGEANSIGVSLGNSLSTGFASADMASSQAAVQKLLQGIVGRSGEFQSTGQQQGQAYANGVQSADGYGAGAALAQNADGGARSVDGSGAGANFGAGFVAGIRSYIGAAISAATEMVNAAKAAADAAAKSASPSREMIKRGKWFGQGWIIGIKSYNTKSYGAGRDMVVEALNGVTTYTNYAAEDSGEVFAQSFLNGVKAGFDGGIEDVYLAMKDEMGRVTFTDFMWNTIAPQINGKGYTRMGTGNVYDSMKSIEAAGYKSLDDYLKAKEKFAEQQVKWDKDWADYEWDKMLKMESIQDAQERLNEAREKGDAKSIKTAERSLRNAQHAYDQIIEKGNEMQQEWHEWLEELGQLNALSDSLTASVEDIQHWLPLYELKSQVNEGIDDAEDWSNTLTTLVNKTGVVFSKNFVERIIDGGEDFQEALKLMKDASAEQIQEMVDSFDDLARAERETEINQRSLWVNSLYAMKHQGQNAKDWLLDFRETCLDVKEAIYSNDSLYNAFQQLGVTVEEFALGLQASEYTMDDFLSYLDGFTASVADGFNGLSRDSQTGLEAWIHTLENNIVESEHWAANLENVFSRAGGEGVDAFREAVMKGGFDKFGQIIAQMADASTEDINKAIETYWLALQTGEKTGITSFLEISGSELAASAVEGIKEGTDIIADQIREMIGESAALGTENAVAYRQIGEAMGQNLSLGVKDSTNLSQQAFTETYTILLEQGNNYAAQFEDVGLKMSMAVAQGIINGTPYIQQALDQVVILKNLAISYADEAAAAASRAASAAASAAQSAAAAASAVAEASSYGAVSPQINWYATGGIFDKASIIGVGEAGREAVVPLSGAAMQPFASAIAEQINNNGDSISNNITLNANVNNIATAETLARRVGVYTNRQARKRGRRKA